MANKKTVLSDADILSKLEQKAKQAVAWFDSRLSRERQHVLDYYNGKRPIRQHQGSSSYVSTDVYDGVEMIKSQILETFAGGDEIVQFDPVDGEPSQIAQIATDRARYIVFRRNPAFKIFHDALHDGFTARVGIVKVFWEEEFEYVDEDIKDQPYETVQGLAAHDEVDELEAEQHPETGLFNGSLTRKIDKSHICIVTVAPEEFLIETRAVTMHEAGYHGQRTLKTRDELIRMGYAKKVVDTITWDESANLELAPEVIARNSSIESAQALNDPIQPELQKVLYYESYIRMQIDSAKGVRLYKICHAGNVLLDKQEVNRSPFIPYVPLPIPHLFYGNNFAARLIPIQNANTVLKRAILDHTAITVNPRWLVINGGLSNPREMIDNRLGGLVNIKREGAVAPLQYPNLNPFVFQTIEKLDQDKEQTTGVSSLSQGLNKDAISSQNSQGLVDQMVSLSGQRQKIAARNFAYNFLVPLFLEVIRLDLENDPKSPLKGMTTVEDWGEGRCCTVSMHLGYGERDQHIAKRSAFYNGLDKDPVLGPLFGQPQRFAFARDTAKIAGVWKDEYLAKPVPGKTDPQPNPLEVRKLDIEDKKAQAALITAQSHVQNVDRLSALDISKDHLDRHREALKGLQIGRDAERHDLEAANRVDISQREMGLEEKMRPKELKGIVSPNG